MTDPKRVRNFDPAITCTSCRSMAALLLLAPDGSVLNKSCHRHLDLHLRRLREE